MPKRDQIDEFLLLSLEHERLGADVYRAALLCAIDARLAAEWRCCLDETLEHVNILEEVCKALGLDSERDFPRRDIGRRRGASLVEATLHAKDLGSHEAAQIIACECVVLAETKDHLDWELLGHVADALDGEAGEGLREACELVAEQEERHLQKSRAWCTQLWLRCLEIDPIPAAAPAVRSTVAPLGASGVLSCEAMS